LFIAVGEADFFSAFALVSGTALSSELTTGVVLIIFLLQFFYRNAHFLAPVDFSDLRGIPYIENIQYTGQWWANSAMTSLFSSGPAATHAPQFTH
jgi:hypothetical protein